MTMTTDLPMKMKDSHTKSVFRHSQLKLLLGDMKKNHAKVVLPTKINNFSAQFVIIHSVLKAT